MAPPPAQGPMGVWKGGASAGRRYSFVARARASLRRGHRRGPWLHPLCYPRWLCGCCAPRPAATRACSPSTWRQCGECVGEWVRGVAERGGDRCPPSLSIFPARDPPLTEGGVWWGDVAPGHTWRCGRLPRGQRCAAAAAGKGAERSAFPGP